MKSTKNYTKASRKIVVGDSIIYENHMGSKYFLDVVGFDDKCVYAFFTTTPKIQRGARRYDEIFYKSWFNYDNIKILNQ